MPLPVRSLILAALLLVTGADVPLWGQTAALRDIAVMPGGRGASITFLLNGKAAVVVVEKKGERAAQVRMKSLSATSAALSSATVRPGVASIRSRIERGDVLVTDVVFDARVKSIAVTNRESGRVTVQVVLSTSNRSSPATGSANEADPRPSGTTRRNRWSLTTVVIDAGHGGKDPGAIGLGGVREKDVTLAVALEVRKRIRAGMPGVKVIMTRADDSFVELYRRGQIANAAEGRLFISIHCNSMPTRPNPATGHEVYILRPGRSDDAARVAAAENGAIRFEGNQQRYGGGTDAEIVATMAQTAFVRFSEEAADRIRSSLKGATSIPDRGVHQAGFLVLVGAAMPAVLIELGYLSNERDVRVLKSAGGRKKLAAAIYNGIRSFERYYSDSIGAP